MEVTVTKTRSTKTKSHGGTDKSVQSKPIKFQSKKVSEATSIVPRFDSQGLKNEKEERKTISQYRLKEDMQEDALDKDMETLTEEFCHDFDSLAPYIISCEKLALYQVVERAESIFRNRIRLVTNSEDEKVLARDVSKHVAYLTKQCQAGNLSQQQSAFTTCMAEIRKIARLLQGKSFQNKVMKQALDIFAQALDNMSPQVRQSCIAAAYDNKEKKRQRDVCPSEKASDQLRALQNVQAYWEYMIDINGMMAVEASVPGDESSGEEEFGDDIDPTNKETLEEGQWFDIDLLEEVMSRHRKTVSATSSTVQMPSSQHWRPQDGDDLFPGYHAEFSKPIPVKEAENKPAVSIETPEAITYPSLDEKIQPPAEKVAPAYVPPIIPTVSSGIVPPSPSVIETVPKVEPCKVAPRKKSTAHFDTIDKLRKDVTEAKDDPEKQEMVVGRLKSLIDVSDKAIVKRTKEVAMKPDSVSKQISRVGMWAGLRAMGEDIVPPELQTEEVMEVNKVQPTHSRRVCESMTRLLEMPVVRNSRTRKHSPQEVRRWKDGQLKGEVKDIAQIWTQKTQNTVCRHIRTVRNLLENKTYPFDYFHGGPNSAAAMKLPEDLQLRAKSIYNILIGFPVCMWDDYEKIHGFNDDELRRFHEAVFSKEAIRWLFGALGGRTDSYTKPSDCYRVASVNHTPDMKINMLYSPGKCVNYLEVVDSLRNTRVTFPCSDKTTQALFGATLSTNEIYKRLGVGIVRDSGNEDAVQSYKASLAKK